MSTSLARISGDGLGLLERFQPLNLQEAMAVADTLSKSGLLPDHLRGKPADVLVTILAGAEFGLGMMQSFRALYVFQGKLGVYTDFLVAKVKQHPQCIFFNLVESNGKVATYETQRKGEKVTSMSFTIDEAEAAGITARNPTYKTYPAAMLRHRAAGHLTRAVYPDALFGVYTMDEIKDMEAAEKDVTPPPPPQPETKRSVEPSMSSVEATTKRMMAAGKGLAKDKPAPIRVVDVAPDQTEEEATALTVEPDPLETEAIRVSEALSEVVAKFNADPKSPNAPALRKQIATLRATLAQLQAQMSV